MARRAVEADENTKQKRSTGTRGGSRGQRAKQGHTQAAAQALDETGGSRKGSGGARASARGARKSLNGAKRPAKVRRRPEPGTEARGPRGGSSGAARRGTGARAQKRVQRGEMKKARAGASGKKRTRSRSTGRVGAS